MAGDLWRQDVALQYLREDLGDLIFLSPSHSTT